MAVVPSRVSRTLFVESPSVITMHAVVILHLELAGGEGEKFASDDRDLSYRPGHRHSNSMDGSMAS